MKKTDLLININNYANDEEARPLHTLNDPHVPPQMCERGEQIYKPRRGTVHHKWQICSVRGDMVVSSRVHLYTTEASVFLRPDRTSRFCFYLYSLLVSFHYAIWSKGIRTKVSESFFIQTWQIVIRDTLCFCSEAKLYPVIKCQVTLKVMMTFAAIGAKEKFPLISWKLLISLTEMVPSRVCLHSNRWGQKGGAGTTSRPTSLNVETCCTISRRSEPRAFQGHLLKVWPWMKLKLEHHQSENI